MASINQTFRTGQEYLFSISQIPEISTDTAVIYSVTDASNNLTARLVNDTTFGLTYNGSGDTFTSNIQLVINGVSDYSNGLIVNFTVNGARFKEPVRIYNSHSSYTMNIQIFRIGASAPALDIYYCVGTTEGTYTHYTNSVDYDTNGVTPIKTISVGPGKSLWIYSDNMTKWANNSGTYISISTPAYNNVNHIQISGDIMSLITGNLQSYSFYNLFKNFHTLGTVSQTLLPATTLAASCYKNMFAGCSSLTTAPNLPATTLAASCYENMFDHCSSLTTAPNLPATTLAASCYYGMFKYCKSLTTAPNLPATTLSTQCYEQMFQNCSSLTTAPNLPATTLSQNCYREMFSFCLALTTAPNLPATTLAEGCYNRMFFNCQALTTAPTTLPATTLVSASSNYAGYWNGCYTFMFASCTSLTTAPKLPAATLTKACYYSMFNSCTSLNYIKCLATDISATDCTNNWVYNVANSGTFIKTSGVTWPIGDDGVPSGWSEMADFGDM